MKYLFLEYPKCTTCQKAKKWLNDNQIEYEDRHIVENNPTEEELQVWIKRSGLPIKRFFNTSGLMYKDLNLKEELPKMSEAEQIKLLSTHGMLVKRPLLISKDLILIGFKDNEWKQIIE